MNNNNNNNYELINLLNELRHYGGPARTRGLSDDTILRFAKNDQSLVEVINEAHAMFCKLCEDESELLSMDEDNQIKTIQTRFVNFYEDDAVNPFAALAGRGPWIVTLKGAVVHDSGGYGMLGLGHAPALVLDALNQNHVMANIMTSNISQKRFADAMRKEIGHTRRDSDGGGIGGGCPYDRFLCMNSGSEAVSVAARLSDVNAKLMTDPGGKYPKYSIQMLSLKGGFHGRTDRPAQFSSSSSKVYSQHLATFRDREHELIEVEPNNVEELIQIFDRAKFNNIFIEAFFIEPVMGEGNPGLAITREFYDAAVRLTRLHGSLLLVDSIQAGLRAHGVLSIIDYPGFQSAQAPDMETYSKALNAGQYPLSVLAMTERAANLYRKGIYGNTMTTNPRSLDVACAALRSVTTEMRENIRIRGNEFKERLQELKNELGNGVDDMMITSVQGTGLLVSAELNSKQYKASGIGSVEECMRMNGVSVIHGGVNSLRYTPHFNITSDEIDLIVNITRKALVHLALGEERKKADEEEVDIEQRVVDKHHHHYHRRVQAGSIVQWITY